MARNAPILERKYFAKGQVIVTEGDVGDMAYIIQSGKAMVYRTKRGKTVPLARLGVGDIFGESALLFDEPRMASVKAMENCNVIIITRQVLSKKLKESDPTIRAIVKMTKERLKTSNAVQVLKTATGLEDVQKQFDDAFKLVMRYLSPAERKRYQHEASPILREFLDLTQRFIDRTTR